MRSSDDLIRVARRELSGRPDRVPRLGLAVITCMDARVDPWRLLEATAGDMHVIRNAGGIVTDDVLRSVAVSVVEFGTKRIRLIMHTDCGMHRFDEEGFRRRAVERGGDAPPWPMGGFDDLTAEVVRGVELLRSWPLLRTAQEISGHVYDLAADVMEPVVT